MSYDIYLENPDYDHNINYTSNVSEMWLTKEGTHLSDLHGMKAKEAIRILRTMAQDMVIDRDELIKLNPENGWGDFNGALQTIFECIDLCKVSPESTFMINR